VAQLVQVLRELDDARLVVDRERRRRDAGMRAVDEHERLQLGREARELVVGHARCAQHDRVAPPPHLGREQGLVARRLRGVGHEHAVAVVGGRLGEAREHGLEGGVGEVGHDEGDGRGLPEREAAGQVARAVVELGGGCAHSLGHGGLAHEAAVHDPRDGRGRDARVRGDIRDRRGARASCHAESFRCSATLAARRPETGCLTSARIVCILVSPRKRFLGYPIRDAPRRGGQA
jgi:hypothetical protein